MNPRVSTPGYGGGGSGGAGGWSGGGGGGIIGASGSTGAGGGGADTRVRATVGGPSSSLRRLRPMTRRMIANAATRSASRRNGNTFVPRDPAALVSTVKSTRDSPWFPATSLQDTEAECAPSDTPANVWEVGPWAGTAAPPSRATVHDDPPEPASDADHVRWTELA